MYNGCYNGVKIGILVSKSQFLNVISTFLFRGPLKLRIWETLLLKQSLTLWSRWYIFFSLSYLFKFRLLSNVAVLMFRLTFYRLDWGRDPALSLKLVLLVSQKRMGLWVTFMKQSQAVILFCCSFLILHRSVLFTPFFSDFFENVGWNINVVNVVCIFFWYDRLW